jgi:hypothetical protein
MKITSRHIKAVSAVLLPTTLLTWFFYAHEAFPKPLRAITALFGTPVAVASGISHYLNLGIEVYETLWAVIVSNLIFSILFIYLADKFIHKKKQVNKT